MKNKVLVTNVWLFGLLLFFNSSFSCHAVGNQEGVLISDSQGELSFPDELLVEITHNVIQNFFNHLDKEKKYDVQELVIMLFKDSLNPLAYTCIRLHRIIKPICSYFESFFIEHKNIDACWEVIKARDIFLSRVLSFVSVEKLYGFLKCFFNVQVFPSNVSFLIPINKQDDLGNTLLHYAAQNGGEELTAFLLNCLEHDNGKFLANKQGQTPLHIAASCNYVSALRLFLAKKNELEGGLQEFLYCDPSDQDTEGYTAYDYANANGCQGALQVLEEHEIF